MVREEEAEAHFPPLTKYTACAEGREFASRQRVLRPQWLSKRAETTRDDGWFAICSPSGETNATRFKPALRTSTDWQLRHAGAVQALNHVAKSPAKR